MRIAVFLALVPCLGAQSTRLLDILSEELDRNYKALQEKGDPAPYYLAYAVSEVDAAAVTASQGALLSSSARRSRTLDVTIRVGNAKVDNYHSVRGEMAQFTAGVPLALDDSPDAIKRTLWRETDRCYRLAAERLINIKTSKEVKVAEKEQSDDFSDAPPLTARETPSAQDFDRKDWEKRARKLSESLAGRPNILASSVSAMGSREVKYFVASNGARLMHGRPTSRVMLSAQAKSDDGMDVATFDSFDANNAKNLPKEGKLKDAFEKLGKDVEGLRAAPIVEPYVGPAILSGRAAGVFFHEIFGHRIEGHRLKDESDGQTFAKSIGTKVLPDFLSVIFDPTLKQSAGEDLNGWYQYDDEGVAARRVPVVEGGVLKTFLMSRTPIPNIPVSNGHGRRQPGNEVVARQSNLLVEASRKVSEKELREMLVAELKKQNKQYGYYFQEITGGFTNTSRRGSQAFKVIPLVVYRIYVDGREELVRGADIVGTPLASFAKIIAAADKLEVFNGYCGAESGSVPVSAISPALLVSELEIQKKESSRERPPLLPAPAGSSSITAAGGVN
ncbi:MAG: peptidase U62 [Bryobacterales bacterium]|nr:peptidase U62 [Bryobacterales bacterium]